MTTPALVWFRLLLRIAALCLFTTSFILPALIIYRSTDREFGELELLAKTREQHSYLGGCIHRGELWFTESTREAEAVTFSYELMRLDLKTGTIHPTGIQHKRGDLNPVPFVLGNDLYARSRARLYRFEDSMLVDVGSLPDPKTQRSNIFLFEGRPTSISQFDESRYRLIQLANGNWVEGREVLLPDLRQSWRDDLGVGQKTLIPSTSFNESLEKDTVEGFWIHVTSDGLSRRLFLFMHGWVCPANNPGVPDEVGLSRRGLEFADEASEIVSAINTENWRREATGWQSEIASSGALYPAKVDSDAISPLLSFSGPSSTGTQMVLGRICRLDQAGNRVDVAGMPADSNASIMIDSLAGVAYLVEQTDTSWNRVSVHRIVGNQIEPPFLRVQSSAKNYVNRWQSIVVGMIAAWLAHFLLLTCATACWRIRSPLESYEYELQQAAIAHIWRRLAAGTFDTCLIVLISFGLWQAIPQICGWLWSETEYTALGDQLQAFASNCHLSFKYLQDGGQFEISELFALTKLLEPTIADHWKFLLVWSTLTVSVCLVKLYVEGRSGFTPGKSLFRIRTVNASLANPGILSSMIRTVCLPLDFMIGLSPLPAMLIMTLSSAHRRIGDHFAATIVINAGSIKEVDWQRNPEIDHDQRPDSPPSV